jgi:hypothetical protein
MVSKENGITSDWEVDHGDGSVFVDCISMESCEVMVSRVDSTTSF